MSPRRLGLRAKSMDDASGKKGGRKREGGGGGEVSDKDKWSEAEGGIRRQRCKQGIGSILSITGTQHKEPDGRGLGCALWG